MVYRVLNAKGVEENEYDLAIVLLVDELVELLWVERCVLQEEEEGRGFHREMVRLRGRVGGVSKEEQEEEGKSNRMRDHERLRPRRSR